MMTIIVLSLAGAVIAAVVGTLWYSNATPMGKLHMRYLGFDKLTPEEQRAKMQAALPMMPKMYAGQLLLSLLLSFSVVYTIMLSVQNGVPFEVAIWFPLMNWLCFMVPAIGASILWSNIDRSIAWKKFFSDISSNLVTILLIAFLTKLFI